MQIINHPEGGVPQSSSTVPRENWAGRFRYNTIQVLQPVTVEQVQEAVASASNIRALGTRHSFNGIADCSVAQISTVQLKDVDVDSATQTLRVRAGIKYGELAVQLDKAGFALANICTKYY